MHDRFACAIQPAFLGTLLLPLQTWQPSRFAVSWGVRNLPA